jgi:hypothetical protein
MAYRRLIELLDTDCSTVLATLNDNNDPANSKVTHAEFELLRSGGCGGGSITFSDSLTARSVEVGQFVRMKYDASTNWYIGRVEEVGYKSSSGATARLFGLYGMLSDVVVGGLYFGGADRLPHIYARSDWFINDPDHSLQSFDTCSRYDDFVTKLYVQYVQPDLPFITLGPVIQPTTSGLEGFQSQTFRGGDSVGQIIRHVATQMENASFGVDENNVLFMYPESSTLLKTFQEGVDCESIDYKRDKSLQYTRIWLTGDYIYMDEGFYRYQAVIRDEAADITYGNKPIKLYVPWVRTDEEAFDFGRGFFKKYANPTTRVTFTTSPQTTLLKPQNGKLRVKDRDGLVLTLDSFSSLKCTFDAAPYFTIECGPEDIQFGTPPEPNRWELPPNLDFENGKNNPPPPPDPTFSFSDSSVSYNSTIGNPSLSTPDSGSFQTDPPPSYPLSFSSPYSGSSTGGPPPSGSFSPCDPQQFQFTLSGMGPSNCGYPAYITCSRGLNGTYTINKSAANQWRLNVVDPCTGNAANFTLSYTTFTGYLGLSYTVPAMGWTTSWMSTTSYSNFCDAAAAGSIPFAFVTTNSQYCGWIISNAQFI